jgi:nuclear transport factor 2 (NTF2) superfamily protein
MDNAQLDQGSTPSAQQSTDGPSRPGFALPEDPAAFVAAAERATNTADFEAAAALYAHDATLESITDGAYERYEGVAEIHRAWQMYMGALRSLNFQIQKRLLSAAGNTIINDWRGTIGRGTPVRGIECWRFDVDGKVKEHRLYGFLSVRPATSVRQQFRMLVAYPRTAMALKREQSRHGRSVGAEGQRG